jgi:OPT family oligopeptide transporter
MSGRADSPCSYNVSRILNDDFTLNEEKYQAYSIPYMSTTNALLYAAFLGLYLSLITHVALWHRKEMVEGFMSVFRRKKYTEEFNDVHTRLMGAYKEAPEWWYLILMGIAFILACVGCACWPTGMPIWGVVLAIAMCVFIQIPVGMVLAVTNMEVTLNVIAEYIAGYALEGQAIPNMIFKMFGYIATAQSIQFSADLKMAHYLKIPPRVTFWAQVYATVLAAFVALGVNAWALENIENICDRHQKAHFICPGEFLSAR